MPTYPWQDPLARRVLDQMADRFVALDGQDRILFANARLREAKAEALVGRSYWDVWPHLRDTIVETSYARARATGEAVRFQTLHPRGSWLEVDAYPEGDGTLGVYFRNLTRQRQRADGAALRPLIDAIPHIAWTSDPAGGLIDLNERWWEYTGDDRDHPSDPLRFVHPDDVAAFRTVQDAAISRGEAFHGELRLRRKDGADRWHLVRVEPRRDAEGALVGWVGTSTDVHDRRVAEAATERSERRLDQLVESLGDALYTLDREWRIERFNAGAEALTGRKREDVIGRLWLDAFPALRGTEFQARYERTMATGEPQAFEALSPLYHRWVDARSSLYGDGIAISLRDVTDRRSAQDAVLETQERLRYALRAAGAGVWHLDLATQRGEWSPEYRDLFGIGPDDPVPGFQEWQARLHPDDRERVTREVRAAVAGAGDFRLEYRILHPARGERWLVTAGGQGAPGRVTGITYDVTEAKRQVAILEATLKIGGVLASEREPGRIVQALTDFSTTAVGAQFGSFFYAKPDETGERFGLFALSGAPRDAFDRFPPVRNTPLFQPTFNGTGTVRSDDVLADPRYGAWSGGQGLPPGHLPVRSYLAVPMRARSGEVLGGLLFGHAQTGRFTPEHERLVEAFASQAAVAYENALLYERLQEANEGLEARVAERTHELQEANEMLQGFTYHVSHDLRTPLRAIVSTSRLIEMDHGEGLPPEARVLLRRQAEAGRKLGELIDDLLSLSRLAREQIGKRSIDLTALVQDVAAEALAAHPESRVEVAVEDGLAAQADPRLLRLALLNLIENAVKYSPEGGTVAVGAANGAFFVRDEGIGFEPRYAERIFEPFQRLHRDEEFRGTGIGLANVRQVVERHGGRVWAEGHPGRGATFWFTLP